MVATVFTSIKKKIKNGHGSIADMKSDEFNEYIINEESKLQVYENDINLAIEYFYDIISRQIKESKKYVNSVKLSNNNTKKKETTNAATSNSSRYPEMSI